MRRLLLSTAIGALCFGAPAYATVTDTFCGPSSGQGCETGIDEHMVFLQAKTNTMHGLGNIGSQTGLPLMHIDSSGGMLDVFLDLKNGFATIKPHNGISFNGVKITIPGFEFTGLIFDDQLTPTLNATDTFTVDGITAGADDGSMNEVEAANTDKEYSIRALGGAFDEVDITSLTGFDEIKHIEVSGVCQILASGTCQPVVIVDTPEPASMAVLGFGVVGLLGTTMLRRRAH